MATSFWWLPYYTPFSRKKRCYKVLGVNLDKGLAVQLFQEAANQGYAKAQPKLGVYYAIDLDDQVMAVQWFQKAADQGLAEAQASLSYQYFHGLGVPKNQELAAKWIQKAVDQGDPLAHVILSSLYNFGLGVPLNKTLAEQLLKRVATLGPSSTESFGYKKIH
jgi:TPR repeat protein